MKPTTQHFKDVYFGTSLRIPGLMKVVIMIKPAQIT